MVFRRISVGRCGLLYTSSRSYKGLLHFIWWWLSLLQVHLQTQQQGKLSIVPMAVKIYTNDGILAFYNGLSASLLRQVSTYSQYVIHCVAAHLFDDTIRYLRDVEKANFARLILSNQFHTFSCRSRTTSILTQSSISGRIGCGRWFRRYARRSHQCSNAKRY